MKPGASSPNIAGKTWPRRALAMPLITILYNSQIMVSHIPAKAYEYVVNGKIAIEWVMERYQVTVHK
jgi:predicted helicase